MFSPTGSGLVTLLGVLAAAGPTASQAPLIFANSSNQAAYVSHPMRTLLSRPALLEVDGVPLADALAELQHRSGVALAFSPSLVPEELRVSCKCRYRTVGEALDRLLVGSGFHYVKLTKLVLVEPLSVGPSPDVGDGAVPAVLSGLPVQERVIAGVVVDGATQRPLSGAQVVIQGTTLGTLADGNGRFRLTNVQGAEVTLRVVMIGYRTATQPARVGTLNVRIALSETAVALEQIVVTGVPGGTKVRAVGNAVGKVDTRKAAESAPITNLQSVLQGRVAGVNIVPPSGNVGAGSVMRVRGSTSLSLSNDPLIFVDGIRVDNNPNTGPTGMRESRPMSRINDFNPEDIESIEVIKGPAAATLYGTEASHGVIQIITKKGAAGRPKFDVSVKQGANFFLDPLGRIPSSYRRDPSGALLAWHPVLSEDSAGRRLFTYGPVRQYSANLSGGTDRVRYYLSADNDYGQGYINYNWNKKTTGRANISAMLSDAFDVNANFGWVKSRTRFAQAASPYGVWDGIVWGHAQRTRNRGWYTTPPEEIEKIEAYADVNRMTWSLQANWRPFEWLAQRLSLGEDVVNDMNTRLFPRQANPVGHWFGAFAYGDRQREDAYSDFRTFDYSATATYNLNADLRFLTSVGAQYYSKHYETMTASGRVFPAPSVETVGGAAVTFGSEDIFENKTVGTFAQEQVEWKNRVFLTFAVRGDDNSAFGTNYDFVVYPKVSASWVINEESWFNFDWVNTLKLRAAWGQAGQQPDVFAAIRLYAPATGPGDQSALTPLNIGNPDLKPEKGQELEMGLDAGLFDERLSVNFSLYRQKTIDAILERSPPLSLGFPGSQFVNLGRLSNKGEELAITGQVLNGDKAGLNVGFTVAHNISNVDDLGGLPNVVTSYQEVREGYPIMGYWGVKIVSADMDPKTLKITNPMCMQVDGSVKSCLQSAPRLYFGPQDPVWQGAINSTVTLFRNVSLYANVEYKGGYYRGDGDIGHGHMLMNHTTAMVGYPDGRGPNPIVRAYFISPGNWGQAVFIHKASFARLRELSGTFNLPNDWIKRAGASRASLNVAARNLWFLWQAQPYLWDRKVIDPETRHKGAWAGQTQTILAPYSSIVTTFRVSF